MSSPVREYRVIVDDSGNPGYVNRIMIGHPVVGSVRIEWVQARYGQIIPMNWSQVEYQQGIMGYYPMRFQVADAQNMICKVAIEKDFEWLLLYEHDVLPPPDAFIKLNQYMRDESVPVMSGLYFSRGHPSEPLIFRGRGTGVYTDFTFGDKVWCDGVPTGFLLIHMGVIRAMWEESDEYNLNGQTVRRIFSTPREMWLNPQTGDLNTVSGTSDLDWCTRVIEGNYFAKAGWNEYQNKDYPFLVDTSIFCRHINPNGEQFPPAFIEELYINPPALGVSTSDGLAVTGRAM